MFINQDLLGKRRILVCQIIGSLSKSNKAREKKIRFVLIVFPSIQEPIPTLDSQYQLFSQSNDTQLLIALVGDTEGVLFLNLMSNTVQTIVKP